MRARIPIAGRHLQGVKRRGMDGTMMGSGALDKLLGGFEVTLELKEMAANPMVAGSIRKKGLEHYRCRLLRPGKELDVYLSVSAEDDPPTLSDVLFMLVLDASGCDMMAGFEKYRDKWNSIFGDSGKKAGEMELFWEELESRCRQTEKLRDFLGPSAYEELLAVFGLRRGSGPELLEGNHDGSLRLLMTRVAIAFVRRCSEASGRG